MTLNTARVYQAYHDGQANSLTELESLASTDHLANALPYQIRQNNGDIAGADELLWKAYQNLTDYQLRWTLAVVREAFSESEGTPSHLSELDEPRKQQLRDCYSRLSDRINTWGQRAIVWEVYYDTHSCKLQRSLMSRARVSFWHNSI